MKEVNFCEKFVCNHKCLDAAEAAMLCTTKSCENAEKLVASYEKALKPFDDILQSLPLMWGEWSGTQIFEDLGLEVSYNVHGHESLWVPTGARLFIGIQPRHSLP